MPDGQIFDPEFYAAAYPDVVAVLGKDEAKLYLHYTTYGKNEGRLPCAPSQTAQPVPGQTAPSAPAAPAQAVPAPAVPVTNDLVVTDIDGGAAKLTEVQLGYCALPQNVKNFYNRKDIHIYTCTRDYIGTVSDRKSLGYSEIHSSWTEGGPVNTIAKVYVCGSTNSFMPPRYTLYHELGHVLDNSLPGGRYSSKWEGWTEMIPYSKTQVYNQAEAFCEAFAGYFERPDTLKKTAPNAYLYIENITVNMK